jgi:hypothetical protein
MKNSMVIFEVARKQQLIASRLAGHQGRPLCVALLMTAVDHLCQLGEPEGEIRALFERIMHLYKGTAIIMPSPNEISQVTQDEVAKALGDMHDEKKEKG